MRTIGLLTAGLLTLASWTSAQTVSADRLSVGGTKLRPDTTTTVRLDGLATSGTGTTVLFGETDGDVFRRALAKGDLPAVTVFTDQANAFGAFAQTFGGAIAGTSATFSTTLGVTGLSTLTGGFSAGANSSVTGTFGVSGLSTLTGGYAASADSSIAGSLTLTGTGAITAAGDLAVNGGDITSSASPLNINPAGRIHMVDNTTFADNAGTNNYASQTTGWRVTAAGAADFRYLFVDEMHAKAFIADLEMALNGGQIIAKSTATLASAFTCPAAGGTATMTVNDFPGFPNIRVFAVSDWVVARTFSRTDGDSDGNTDLTIGDCVGQVSAYVDGSGTQSWTFTRGSGGNAGAMASSTVVPVDAPVIDFGVSGQGFLIASANDGAEGVNSPYWQVVTWTTAPVAANMAVQTRWGNLNGAYGYSAPTYGFAAGDSTASHVTVEATNGVRLRNGSVDYVAVNASNGVIVGRNATGYGNLWATTSGDLLVRQGSVTRIQASASNGNVDWLDDDGTTVRARVGASATYFGSTTGARLQVNYSGAGTTNTQWYDEAGTLYGSLDSTNGFLLGNWTTTGSTKGYAQITDRYFRLCKTGVGCTLEFDGNTGNITSTGNLSIQGNATVAGSGTFAASGITMDTSGIRSAVSGSIADGNSYRFVFSANGMTAGGLYAYTDATNNVLQARMVGASASDNYRVEQVVDNTYPTGAGSVSTQLLSGPTGLQWSVNINDGAGATNSLTLTKNSFAVNGSSGETQTITVRNSAGTGTCTIVFTQGLKTGGTCS